MSALDPGQSEMVFDDAEASTVEDAFADGRLWLIVDKAEPYHQRLSMFEGSSGYDGDIRWVHVMSRPARGEIRGYAVLDDGSLRVRLPNYTGDWPDMDMAVAARVAAEGRNG